MVTLRNADSGPETTVRAKYVVGCDGARSMVRDSIGAVHLMQWLSATAQVEVSLR